MAEFQPVLLTLPSSTVTPSLALEVLPYGLTIHRIYAQAGGRTHDLVIGPENPQDHVHQKYTNSIVGRYSNRIPVGVHKLQRHGISSEFIAKANENPQVSLHGGPVGFDARIWELIKEPELFTPAELAHLPAGTSPESFAIFKLVSDDGDQGYPGTLLIEVLIALIESEKSDTNALGSVAIVYRAKLVEKDGGKTVTPVNLTQHWGFNLDASLKEGPETLTVKNHKITIKSGGILERDSLSLATGEIIPSAGNKVHSHDNKLISDSLPEGGYDDYYVLNSSKLEGQPKRIALNDFTPQLDLLRGVLDSKIATDLNNPVVELVSAKSGLKVSFVSNQPGLMFYTNGLARPEKGARKTIHGGSGVRDSGDSYGQFTAAFLEFHEPLTAFLRPSNRDADDSLLTSDELYNNFVRMNVQFTDIGA